MEIVNPVSRIVVLKYVGPPLVPFFKMFALFYVLYPKSESSVGYCIFKCAPLICLMAFVYSYGTNATYRQGYKQKIMIALAFSCLGDAFLVWHHHYLSYAIVFFGLAHIFYICAFGFCQWHWKILPLPLTLCSLVYLSVRSYLSGPIIYFGIMYALILSLMIWRALAQLAYYERKSIPWTSIACALGGILFCISDKLLSVSMFLDSPHPIESLILPTYYGAQLCFAVSVVESQLNSFKSSASLAQSSSSNTASHIKCH